MECPERGRRAAMSDGEFWDNVLGVFPDWPMMIEAESDDEIVDGVPFTDTPCTLCGATRPCAYDAEGRPLIHADSQELGE